MSADEKILSGISAACGMSGPESVDGDDTQVENDINPYIMAALDEELKAAEKEHPDFADSLHYGMGVIGMKYGELYQALGKSLREDSTRDEALDLLCVAWRFCRGDWRQGK